VIFLPTAIGTKNLV